MVGTPATGDVSIPEEYQQITYAYLFAYQQQAAVGQPQDNEVDTYRRNLIRDILGELTEDEKDQCVQAIAKERFQRDRACEKSPAHANLTKPQIDAVARRVSDDLQGDLGSYFDSDRRVSRKEALHRKIETAHATIGQGWETSLTPESLGVCYQELQRRHHCDVAAEHATEAMKSFSSLLSFPTKFCVRKALEKAKDDLPHVQTKEGLYNTVIFRGPVFAQQALSQYARALLLGGEGQPTDPLQHDPTSASGFERFLSYVHMLQDRTAFIAEKDSISQEDGVALLFSQPSSDGRTPLHAELLRENALPSGETFPVGQVMLDNQAVWLDPVGLPAYYMIFAGEADAAVQTYSGRNAFHIMMEKPHRFEWFAGHIPEAKDLLLVPNSQGKTPLEIGLSPKGSSVEAAYGPTAAYHIAVQAGVPEEELVKYPSVRLVKLLENGAPIKEVKAALDEMAEKKIPYIGNPLLQLLQNDHTLNGQDIGQDPQKKQELEGRQAELAKLMLSGLYPMPAGCVDNVKYNIRDAGLSVSGRVQSILDEKLHVRHGEVEYFFRTVLFGDESSATLPLKYLGLDGLEGDKSKRDYYLHEVTHAFKREGKLSGICTRFAERVCEQAASSPEQSAMYGQMLMRLDTYMRASGVSLPHGQTFLHIAAQKGALVEKAIELAGPESLNQKDADGNTALHYAVKWHNAGAIRVIAGHKDVTPNVRNSAGQFPWEVLDSSRVVGKWHQPDIKFSGWPAPQPGLSTF